MLGQGFFCYLTLLVCILIFSLLPYKSFAMYIMAIFKNGIAEEYLNKWICSVTCAFSWTLFLVFVIVTLMFYHVILIIILLSLRSLVVF